LNLEDGGDMGRLYVSAIASELERAIHCTRNNPPNAIIFYKYHLLSGQKHICNIGGWLCLLLQVTGKNSFSVDI
jgi:hypothetical protein